MKKIILSVLFVLISIAVNAQIPYFAGTAGDGNMYGYTSVKFRPGINAQETYTTFQYGIGEQFAVGTDLYTGTNSAYWGILARWGKYISPYLGIGVQVTPSFNLNDSFKLGYTTAALYLNGQITKDGKLFWCSNTWWGINTGTEDTISNWEYIGYTFSLPKGQSISPMIGCIHDWKFNTEADLAVGAYYSFGNYNLYVWGNNFLGNQPRVVIGMDFKLQTKK